jgi:hypothetical protein
MKHELVGLAQRINWKSIEKDFGPYYSDMGRPAVLIRKMVGCMLLKQMYSQSDEAFVDRLIENPYLSRYIGMERHLFSMRSHLIRENPRRRKKAMAGDRKIKTIAGRLVRDAERSLDEKDRLEAYDEQLLLYHRVLGQKRDNKDKIYSFHAPEVSCIYKGKEHKKYEFGNKSGFVITKKSGIIIGAMAFEGSPYDWHTLLPQLH